MTREQAKRVGRMIATARRNQSWSLRRLGVETGISHTALHKLEQGDNTAPNPDWLLRIADALSLDPNRISRVADAQMSENLPSVRTYFRAKYELSPEDIDVIEHTVRDLQNKRKDGQR